MDTASLQPLFEYVEINGFQDLWFENTTAKEVERLFLYACTFGAVPVSAAVRGNGAAVIADPTPAGGVLLDQNQDLVDFATTASVSMASTRGLRRAPSRWTSIQAMTTGQARGI